MTLKFYLHNALTTDTGTLPSSTISASTPTVDLAGTTNRSMDGTIGSSQSTASGSTQATTNAQSMLFGRFCSAPIKAQTIASQTITFDCGFSESNVNSNFQLQISLAVWRPGTGAVVGRITDLSGASAECGTGQSDTGIQTATSTSTSVTSQDGDILVCEIWRQSFAQNMATSYTNTIYYDGTTEQNTSSEAAYVNFTNDVAMQTVSLPPGLGPAIDADILLQRASSQRNWAPPFDFARNAALLTQHAPLFRTTTGAGF
jgi:hypothetical protein